MTSGAPGQQVAQRFTLQSVAGSGGMGTVYRALDQLTNQTVAIKLLHGTAQADQARFLREARLLSELSAECIVRYVAHGLAESSERFWPWSGSTATIWPSSWRSAASA